MSFLDFFKSVDINKEVVVLKNFVLFIKYCGDCNNYSTEFDVLFYINTHYTTFTPSDLSNILIASYASILLSDTIIKKSATSCSV